MPGGKRFYIILTIYFYRNRFFPQGGFSPCLDRTGQNTYNVTSGGGVTRRLRPARSAQDQGQLRKFIEEAADILMKKPVLVVMAAGMGSRYGGLKQIDPVGKNGEIIID